MKIALGGDHRGYDALERVAERLKNQGHQATILGPHTREPCDYPDAAWAVARAVSSGEADLGLLFDGTGLGTSITANKVKGIRAALVHDEITAEMSRTHNDANVICLSADLLGMALIFKIIDTCLACAFSGGRHTRRVRKIAAIEQGQNPATLHD